MTKAHQAHAFETEYVATLRQQHYPRCEQPAERLPDACLNRLAADPPSLLKLLEMAPWRVQRAYAGRHPRFLTAIGKPLPSVTLPDLQRLADSLEDLASAGP